jgi:hypothetical protein
MSSDLAEFLLARIAEDERAARAAQERGSTAYRSATLRDRGFILADSTHIPRWSPARVLAECEAKRRIVEDALADVKAARRRPGWTMPDDEVDKKGRAYRTGFENARAKQLPDVLDRTERLLRLLALPYADHPDYRHEWRP